MRGLKENILYDLKEGVLYNRRKYILIPVLALLAMLLMQIDCFRAFERKDVSFSFAEILIYNAAGMKEYIPARGTKFEIPVLWLGIQIMIAFLIGDYAEKNKVGFGQQILIRTERRSNWFIGKIVFCVIQVLVFYFFYGLCLYIIALLLRKNGLHYDAYFIAMVTGVHIENMTSADLVIAVIVLPILTSLVLSLGQMTASLYIGSISSFMGILIYVVCSAYYVTYLLLGNFSMLARNIKTLDSVERTLMHGIDPQIELIIDLMVLPVIVIIGVYKVKHMDCIGKE